MAYSGFGKDSGPSTQPRAQTPFGNFPRAPSSSPPRSISPSNGPPLNWSVVESTPFKEQGVLTYQRPPAILPQVSSSNSRNGTPTKATEVQQMRRTSSPYSPSLLEVSNNSRGVMEKAQSPSLVYQGNQYVGGQHSHTEKVQQHPISPLVWGSHSKPSSYNTAPPAQKGISSILTKEGTYKTGPMVQTNQSGVPLPKRTRSPTYPSTSVVSPEITFFHPHVPKRSLIDYRDLDAPEAIPSSSLAFEGSFPSRDTSPSSVGIERPFTSSPMWANQSKSSSNNFTALAQEDLTSVSAARGTYQPGSTLLAKKADVPLPKRTRSPPLTSTGEGFTQNPPIASDDQRRAPYLQSPSSTSGQINRAEVAVGNQMHIPAFKKTKIPLPSSSDQVFQENLGTEGERELHAKAKRLARFKDELSEPLNSDSTIKSQKVPARRQNQSLPEKQKFSEDPAVDAMGDFASGNVISDNEGVASSSSIVGLCPDMCPESERAERERKGDLDLYERLDGDRNLTNEFLAVKKYNRTAEREAKLIRPLPILRKTMDYLLNLLGQPYDDRFLGLYNFLWDRMRAIRMDLRMQHIFNLEAIKMLEQMIRLHIIAMHELCEYTKGEGFSEGFDAHLNIEQMNKTSVELFQLYDDHRKKGIDVPSEREFRGYYALLKLDKHPGYKVEPAELSLDLAKMTPEIRQTPEVLFARDVARACRTGNFISFFRLAYKASYLQACLIHAHFSKLRTQALASLHSGLQINQGIPIAHVAKWLGVEGEDIGDLLEYHGFSVKDFEEPYMVKENAFINVDNDFPVKRSKLVDRKRSGAIASDVSFPSLTDVYATEEVPELQLKKDTKPTISRTLSSFAPVSTSQCHDEEMCDLSTISSLSPKGGMQKPMYETSIDLTVPDENRAGHEVQVAPACSFGLNFSSGSAENRHDSIEFAQKPKYEIAFRNSLGRSIKHDLQTTSPITPDAAEEIRYPVIPRDCFVTPIIHQPVFPEQLEDEEQAGIIEEDKSDEVTTSYCDKEVAESKLKLILRIWKRRSVKKKELREHKQLAANTAMKLLSLGPPIWQHEVQSSSYGMFNIDLVMSERHEIEGRSWSVVNPSEVVAAKLVEKNPDAKCLCWKIVVCPLKETLHGDSTGLQNPSAASSWFHSKLMPANNDDDGDLLVSSSGLAIWRNWVPSLSDLDLTCCLSIIKTVAFDDLNEAITGANGVLFILSEYVPLELQKEQLHDHLISLPSGSHLPLLILSGSVEDGSDAFSLAKDLGLHNIDRSVIVKYNIIFLKDEDKRKLDGFFSDQHLREGLEWLASESPPQIVVSEIKTRELVLSHLNSTLEVLDEKINHRIGPNNCISAFNEALDRSMKEVVAAVDANPTGWPCPEIELLEQHSDESRTAACYLPSTGWSSASRAELLMHTLNDAILPSLEDDLSWLSIGLSINDDIEIQKSRLENCLVNYLTETSQMMGVALAKREAGIVLQMCTRLELHNNNYYIIPKWVSIFRRIFNWRLTNFSSGEVSSTYVLEQHYPSAPSSKVLDRAVTFLPPYLAHPSFDELVEVGWHSMGLGSNRMEYEAFRPWSPVASSDATDIAASKDNVISLENEEKSAKDGTLTSYDHSTEEENNGGVQPKCATKATKEADKLSELLEKCNIMQNLIDKKLAIYF